MAGGNPPAPGGRPGVLVLEPGPLQVAMEDVATRQGNFVLEVDRGAGLDARVTIGVQSKAVLDRFGEHRVQGTERGGERRSP